MVNATDNPLSLGVTKLRTNAMTLFFVPHPFLPLSLFQISVLTVGKVAFRMFTSNSIECAYHINAMI